MDIYFGENLKRLRKERELTQETLADYLGVSFQAVSKWERSESYPDITMLPVIASFFDITTDELLGVDKCKKEERIQGLIDEYESICYKDTPKAFEIMKQAVREFPGDFRLLIRYMLALMATKGGINNEPKNIYDEMLSINENIQNHCTSDSIRIKSKRLMGTYYKTLSYTEKDDSYIEKMEEINKDLPVMRDSRDYTATHMYLPGEKHNTACRTAIEELVYLLYGATVNYCYYNDDFSLEFKINAAEKIAEILDIVYDDGNYSKNWHNTVYNCGHLGYWNFELGNTEKATEYLYKCATLSKKYDELPQKSERKSLLFNETSFEKTARGKTMCERMKFLMLERYPLTDEYKNTAEFKKIIDILS